jgi:hypothetical protein
MHHQDFTAAAGTYKAFDRAVQVGIFVSLTAWDLLTDDAFYEEVKKEWQVKLQKHLFLCIDLCLTEYLIRH